MKAKAANLMPVLITGAALLFSVLLHIISRQLAARLPDETGERDETALVEHFEAITYDARVKLGAALTKSNDVSDRIATLFFDDFAIEKVNDGTYSLYYAPATNHVSALRLYPRTWPWPRFIHGQIVRELAAEGALAIGFDSMFSELDQRRPEEDVVDPELGRLTSDEFFAAQIRRAGNVYLGVQRDAVPATLFRTNAAGLASISARTDNAILRRAKPFDEVLNWHPILAEELAKPLGLQLSQASVENDRIVIPTIGLQDAPGTFIIPLNANGSMKMTTDLQIDASDDPNDEGPQNYFPFLRERAWNLGLVLGAKALGLDLDKAEIQEQAIVLRGPNGLQRTIPLDAAGYFYIDWAIRFQDLKGTNTPITFGQLGRVLNDDRFRAQGDLNDEEPFRGKLVLIGSVATGNNMSDFGATPLEAQTPLVTKHVNIANSILMDRFVQRTSLGTELLLIIGLGLVAAAVTWRTRVLAVSEMTIAALCLSYILFTVWMYVEHRYWLPIVMPVAGGLILPHFGLISYRVIFEQKEQRRVRGIFSKIVSPDVVHELLAAEKLSLGGARRRITVFFADVRGFTEFTDSTQQAAEEFAEKSRWTEAERQAYFDRIAAEQLATVNLYLSAIADQIKAQNGTLDKYMGDCVMAFWGAPIPNERHALCCVRAAIAAQRALHALNQQRHAENENRTQQNAVSAAEGKPPLPPLPLLSLGTGIHTGYATVGLMGSDSTILNYTVFGRDVNLASRLEGISGRGRILISGATLEELKRDDPVLAATCVAQPPVTPKGFRKPIAVFEVPWQTEPRETGQSIPAAETQPLALV